MIYFREHAEMSIDILKTILPEDHLLLSSSKRVKGICCNRFIITYYEKESLNSDGQQFPQYQKKEHE